MPPESPQENTSMKQAWKNEFDRAWKAKEEGRELEPDTAPASVSPDEYRAQYLELCKKHGSPDLLRGELLDTILEPVNGLMKVLERLQSGLLSPEENLAYNKRLESFKNFRQFFPSDMQEILTVVPFTNFGNELSPEEVGNSEFFKRLTVAKNGLTFGHTPTPAFYFQLLPDEIKAQCAYTPKYKTDNPYPTIDELKELKHRIVEAFLNLKRLLRPPVKGKDMV